MPEKCKKVTISEEEPQKVLDTFAKGQLLKQDYDGLAETYEVDGLTYQYTGTFPDLEAFSFGKNMLRLMM